MYSMFLHWFLLLSYYHHISKYCRPSLLYVSKSIVEAGVCDLYVDYTHPGDLPSPQLL